MASQINAAIITAIAMIIAAIIGGVFLWISSTSKSTGTSGPQSPIVNVTKGDVNINYNLTFKDVVKKLGITTDHQIKAAMIISIATIIAAFIGGVFILISSTSKNTSTSGSQSPIVNVDKGDVNIIYGYTPEQHEAALKAERERTLKEVAALHGKDKEFLQLKLEKLELELANINLSYEKQIKYFEERIKGLETFKGNISNELLTSAKEALLKGDDSKADELFKQVEDNEIAKIENASKLIAKASFERGKIAEQNFETKQAIAFYNKAVNLMPNNPEYLNNLGVICSLLGRLDEAIRYLKRSLKISIDKLGEDHFVVAQSQINLGNALKFKGKFDDAIGCFNLALKINKKKYGKKSLNVARGLTEFGRVYHLQGNYEKALEFFEKAKTINIEILGEDDPQIATDLNNIGMALQKKGEVDKAIEVLELALAKYVSTYGEDHPYNSAININLGVGYVLKGEFQEAIKHFNTAKKIDEIYLGKDHPRIASAYNNIGAVMEKKGEFKKAFDYYMLSKEIDISTYGEDHYVVGGDFSNLANVSFKQGRWNKAIEYLEKTLKIYNKVYGKDNKFTKDVIKRINKIKSFLKGEGVVTIKVDDSMRK